MPEYAKVVVMGSPISKSNFKLHNKEGRAILPEGTGSYHDRYADYETSICLAARSQNPGVVLEESLIAVLRVYYKSEKRHPDTNNITKSIFDGIEKSGLIVNDAQIRRLIIEEYYDKVEPRFELELFAESVFRMSYDIRRHEDPPEAILYQPAQNQRLPQAKGAFRQEDLKKIQRKPLKATRPSGQASCSICHKALEPGKFVKADGGRTLICKKCFSKLF